jgi:5-methylcytosine-specific restriction endonuclease McrA
MVKRVPKKEVTDEEWITKRAASFRTSSLARAKVLGISNDNVPSPSEIREWLGLQMPFTCYLTDTLIPKGSIEIDHKIPISRGGSFNFNNLGLTTKWFNNAKGDMLEAEFRELLEVVRLWPDKGHRVLARLVASNNRFTKRKSYVRRK